MFEDAECDVNELTHDGAEGGFFGLSRLHEPLVQDLGVGVVARGDEGRPVPLGPPVRGAGLGQARGWVHAGTRWALYGYQADLGGHLGGVGERAARVGGEQVVAGEQANTGDGL